MFLQLPIIRTDTLIVPILHSEATGYGSELDKTKPLVKMASVDITLHYRIELENEKSMRFPLFYAIQHQLLADVKATAG